MEGNMHRITLTSLGLLLALPGLGAQETRTEAKNVPPTCHWINQRVNTLLPHEMGKVELVKSEAGSTGFLRRGLNRIHYHSNPKDQRLLKLEIEPIGEESPGMAVLTATFLKALSAVESVEEGTSLANLLSAENAKDGLSRSIQLANGIKLMKIRTESSAPKFVIVL